jgi:hypothetical protein
MERPATAPTAFAVAVSGPLASLLPGGAVIGGAPGPVVTFPSSARRAGPAASGACSRRAGHRRSYWMYSSLCPVRRRGPSLFERSRELGGACMASRGRRERDDRA